MKNFNAKLNYFTKTELLLWTVSVVFIVTSFFVFDRVNYVTLIASVIGVTSLIFNAKGNPIGQILIIIFGIIYGAISFTFAYYGEMITYLGMTAPMALFSLIAWLKNPFKGNRAEVAVNTLRSKEIAFMLFLTAMVTVVFYFVLDFFHTSNLIPSTISVSTSFAAAYLTLRRSPYFALAYALNDVVLIVLWILAATRDISYLSVIICFIVFLVNDIYGFINWKRLRAKQSAGSRS